MEKSKIEKLEEELQSLEEYFGHIEEELDDLRKYEMYWKEKLANNNSTDIPNFVLTFDIPKRQDDISRLMEETYSRIRIVRLEIEVEKLKLAKD